MEEKLSIIDPSRILTTRLPARQCAALPLERDAAGRLRVGLVTSRESQRWVLPKGWVKEGVPAHLTAEKEARQEAGLVGTVLEHAIGSYSYRKRLHLLASLVCEVDVFPMRVETQLSEWKEKGQRRVCFFALDEAAGAVQEASLARLLVSNWVNPFG